MKGVSIVWWKERLCQNLNFTHLHEWYSAWTEFGLKISTTHMMIWNGHWLCNEQACYTLCSQPEMWFDDCVTSMPINVLQRHCHNRRLTWAHSLRQQITCPQKNCWRRQFVARLLQLQSAVVLPYGQYANRALNMLAGAILFFLAMTSLARCSRFHNQ